VRAFKKHPDSKVQSLASDLINQWTKLIDARSTIKSAPVTSKVVDSQATMTKSSQSASHDLFANTAKPVATRSRAKPERIRYAFFVFVTSVRKMKIP